jgi:homoserine/homoserine lactone efflux protein
MDWHTLAAFLTATLILLLMPGPVMAIIVGNTVKDGRLAGLRTVIGVGLGEILLVLALMASLFLSGGWLTVLLPWLSLACAFYLLWLAVTTLRPGTRPQRCARGYARRPFVEGLAITLSNPAALVFYSAFFLPFLRTTTAAMEQLWLLAAIFLSANLAFDLLCVLFAGWLRPRHDREGGALRITRLLSAAVYLGTSLMAITGFMRIVP